jgi:hypothetical protein
MKNSIKTNGCDQYELTLMLSPRALRLLMTIFMNLHDDLLAFKEY